MEKLVNISYNQTGASTNVDAMGMREMQRMVYEQRNRKYLLVKAPPASGKSRALMFVALDKLANQGIRKVIVAVPEKSIGRSFRSTELKRYGFFDDWQVSDYFNLCSGSDDSRKSARFKEFLRSSPNRILVCTHATLRNALKEVRDEELNDCFFGIDEFHHGSADAYNDLGELIRRLITSTSAHIMAMTGSYFRGDQMPILRPEDEQLFMPSVNYDYYRQLNGYKYLKSLGLGYQFYTGKFITAIPEALDTTKKTLIHIPPVQGRESYAKKYDIVADIIAEIGEVVDEDAEHFIKIVRTPDGRLLKVGDLVEDNVAQRAALQSYLQRMDRKDALDILIALGTAKEGFDWQWCEVCLTIGMRASMTEVVQIIGRCTRDCEGKTHAQFINLVPCPDAAQEEVSVAVNNMLKAIAVSLLMEQVMAPKWDFRTKRDDDEEVVDRKNRVLHVKGLAEPTERAKAIIENDITELKATVLSSDILKQAMANDAIAEVITQSLIPKVIQEKYPTLTEQEVECVRQQLVLSIATQGAEVTVDEHGREFINIANKFCDKGVELSKLSINLIDSINPFQRAYEIMAKSLTPEVLRAIQFSIEEQRSDMSIEEAVLLLKNYLPKYKEEHHGAIPTLSDTEPLAKRIALAIDFVAKKKREYLQTGKL
ncbi:ATP-dependent helicase [Alistipes sp. An31A]|uniref:DEAD/DEAH box helicase n=1 Tax=Alistipes sp. An31A TaxID=1965631 RepID=UPI000B3782D4|nr:DEAD/DEAH box helicase [Alistipes sp. An31A]OUO21107.1 ATP-dependent helicase [Alistipes sp. An31A]